MTSEIQLFSKDLVKLNILQDALGGMVKLLFQFDNGAAEDFATSIHKEGKRVQVYGKFNISEDPAGEVLTIRPIMIDGSLKILFQANAPFSGKTASVVRSSTKAVEREYEISSETAYIEFVPQGKQNYLMKVVNGNGLAASTGVYDASRPSEKPVSRTPKPQHKPEIKPQTKPIADFEEVVISPTYQGDGDDRFQELSLNSEFGTQDDRFASFDMDNDTVVSSPQKGPQTIPAEEIEFRSAGIADSEPLTPQTPTEGDSNDLRRIEQEITVVERQQGQLSRKKQSAIDHLEKIEAEYKKDYMSLEKELDEIKSRMEADASVIEHYKDQDVMPIEVIFEEINLKLEEAEEQIRFFIEAKQRKTMEIENEIKSNKK